MLDNDQSRLMRQLIKPMFFIRYTMFLMVKVLVRYRNSTSTPAKFYPVVVRNSYDLLDRRVKRLEYVRDSVFPSKTLQLASCSLAIASEKSWDNDFEDPEDAAVLHRWNWLVYAESGSGEKSHITDDWGWVYARSWIKINSIGQEASHLEPYTIAERIVNACIYSNTKYGHMNLPDDIAYALELMAYQLADSIEYKEPSSTGNHVFNNARGLYFAGAVFGNQSLIDLAITIFEDCIDRLVTVDGFFSEGSSHYHLLFTRWVFEIVWLSKIVENQKVELMLQPYLILLLERANFFLIYNERGDPKIPLIGDISPDFPPPWLFSIANVEVFEGQFFYKKSKCITLEHSWHNLFNLKVRHVSSLYEKQTESNHKVQDFTNSHWSRYDQYKWTLFLHCVPGSKNNQAGHFHEDLVSFVLFYDGNEVFIDLGRKSYKINDEVSAFQKSAAGHNSILINNLGPGLMPNQQRYPDFYKASSVSVEHKIQKEQLIVKLVHNGFSRGLSNVGYHTREFLLSENGFEVRDDLEGSGDVDLDVVFYLPPNDYVETDINGLLEITFIDNKKKFKFGLKEEDVNMLNKSVVFIKDNPLHTVSQSYGDSKQASCYELHILKAKLPCKHCFKLSVY